MRLFKFIGNLSDRIFTVIMAVLFSQIPVYMNQYTHVLTGAHQEAETTYLELEAQAAKYSQTVEAFLYELSQNENPKVKDHAEVSLSTVERYLDYDKALKSLQKSNIFTRPFKFIQHYDKRIHTALNFTPGMLLNWEGFSYGFVGIVVGMLLIGLFMKLFPKKKTESLQV